MLYVLIRNESNKELACYWKLVSIYLYKMVQIYYLKTDNDKINKDQCNNDKSVYTFQDRVVSGTNMFLWKISAVA